MGGREGRGLRDGGGRGGRLARKPRRGALRRNACEAVRHDVCLRNAIAAWRLGWQMGSSISRTHTITLFAPSFAHIVSSV